MCLLKEVDLRLVFKKPFVRFPLHEVLKKMKYVSSKCQIEQLLLRAKFKYAWLSDDTYQLRCDLLLLY